jgi:hypothetical protein
MTLPKYSTDIDRASLDKLSTLMVGDGLLQQPADTSKLLP